MLFSSMPSPIDDVLVKFDQRRTGRVVVVVVHVEPLQSTTGLT